MIPEDEMSQAVSVVVITRNRKSLLERALSSVLSQTLKELEIIVVDDGSTDGTREWMEGFSARHAVKYIYNTDGLGGNHVRNIGIRAASGKYIALLDDDDEWSPNKIEEQLKGFTDKSIALVYCGTVIIDDKENKRHLSNDYFNKGNVYYKKDDYDNAIEEYKKALKLYPPEKKECSIRINLALAMFYKIDFKVKTQKEFDEIIEKIDEIKDILIEDGCAHRDDNNGHSSEAQKLKNELDMIQEAMRNAEATEEPNNSDDEDDDNTEDTQTTKENSKETRLQEIQREGMNERNDYMKYKESSSDYVYYRGKKW